MHRRALVLSAAAVSLGFGLVPAAATAPAAAAPAVAKAPAYTVTTLDFHVTIPNQAVGGTGTQACLIVGDLYRPASASKTHRVPVILTTNGFGGSKADQDYIGRSGRSAGTACCPTPGSASAAQAARSPSTTRRTTAEPGGS
jgi:ABC-2 type transport system ATP-binding protein